MDRVRPGAVVCTAGGFVLRLVTDLYFAGRLGRVDDLYGALGIAAVFMAWLYLIGRLLVAMFAVSATLAGAGAGGDRPHAGSELGPRGRCPALLAGDDSPWAARPRGR